MYNFELFVIMVGVAQLVEHQVVALVVAGSSPVAHPKLLKERRPSGRLSRFMRSFPRP